MYSGFLTGPDSSQSALLRRVGAGAILAVIVLVVGVMVIRPMITGHDPDQLSFTIDSPGVGVGVEPGTPVILNGVRVGSVTELVIGDHNTSTMTLDINRSSVDGLHTDFGFDFRPANYFGVTSVNILNAGNATSPLVASGDRLSRERGRDYTMATMIDDGSEFVNGSLLPPMTDAIRRSLAYSAALQPLLHTGVIVADTVARTQRAMPAHLVDRYNSIAGALPPFTLGVIDAGYSVYNSDLRAAGDDIQVRYARALQAIADEFFTMVGRLLTSNRSNLTSTVQIVKSAAEVLPSMGEGALTPVTLRTLLTRLNGAFAPGPGGSRSLKVNVELDLLPALNTPVLPLEGSTGSGTR